MSRPKIPRKSTSIDMTAMCDVAFLLLSFFILTTKFKPSEPIPVITPASVASKVAPDKDLVLITIDKEGKVFLEMDDVEKKNILYTLVKTKYNLPIDQKGFVSVPFWGSSFSSLTSYVKLEKEDIKASKIPGIPCSDTTLEKNELVSWMAMVKDVYNGQKMNLLLKGDNISKYPSFKHVLYAFKKNDLLKFQMITNPESVPSGTDLWKQNQNGKGVTEHVD